MTNDKTIRPTIPSIPRLMAIPYLDKIGYRPDIGWGYPENTVLVKNFLMPENERSPGGAARRIETRLFYIILGDSPNGCGVNTPCFPSIKDAIENARI